MARSEFLRQLQSSRRATATIVAGFQARSPSTSTGEPSPGLSISHPPSTTGSTMSLTTPTTRLGTRVSVTSSHVMPTPGPRTSVYSSDSSFEGLPLMESIIPLSTEYPRSLSHRVVNRPHDGSVSHLASPTLHQSTLRSTDYGTATSPTDSRPIDNVASPTTVRRRATLSFDVTPEPSIVAIPVTTVGSTSESRNTTEPPRPTPSSGVRDGSTVSSSAQLPGHVGSNEATRQPFEHESDIVVATTSQPPVPRTYEVASSSIGRSSPAHNGSISRQSTELDAISIDLSRPTISSTRHAVKKRNVVTLRGQAKNVNTQRTQHTPTGRRLTLVGAATQHTSTGRRPTLAGVSTQHTGRPNGSGATTRRTTRGAIRLSPAPSARVSGTRTEPTAQPPAQRRSTRGNVRDATLTATTGSGSQPEKTSSNKRPNR